MRTVNLMPALQSSLRERAYWLGVRDARLGHAESHPVHPYTREELRAYREGYSDQRITDAHRS